MLATELCMVPGAVRWFWRILAAAQALNRITSTRRTIDWMTAAMGAIDLYMHE
jgi:hypothetical protein